MDMNITNISQEKLDAIIKQSSTVIDYDDLHIYKPSSKYNFISFCLILNNQITPLKEVTQLINHIKKQLETIGFNHITIEVDYHDNLKNRKNVLFNIFVSIDKKSYQDNLDSFLCTYSLILK